MSSYLWRNQGIIMFSTFASRTIQNLLMTFWLLLHRRKNIAALWGKWHIIVSGQIVVQFFSSKFHYFNCIRFLYIEYCPFYALIGVRACSISFGFLQSCMAGESLVHALPPWDYLLVFCCCWSHNICHFKSTLCHCLVFPARVLLSSCRFLVFCPIPCA